jgi:hypothetical protein
MTLDYDASRVALFHPEMQAAELPLLVRADALSEPALAAELSRLAYLPAERSTQEKLRLNAAINRFGFGSAQPFDNGVTGTQGFGAFRASDGLAIVALRGTQPDKLRDYLADADIRLVPFSNSGKVHAGFLRCANAILPQVKAWLDRIAPAPSRLVVCGHSLGAAVATLLALPVGAQHLVTFGSPRVGDAAFGMHLVSQVEVTRVVDCVDIVTMVPPGEDAPLPPPVRAALATLTVALDAMPGLKDLLARVVELEQRALRYRHMGRQAYVPHGGGSPLEQPSDAEVNEDRLTISVWRIALGLDQVPLRLLSDHAPINYVRAYWP